MTFTHPQLLLLALLIPAGARWWRVPGRRWLSGLRAALLLLAVVAMAGPRLELTEPGVDVFVVVDRSASVGGEGRASALELLRLLGSPGVRGRHDRLAVIGFGATAALEAPPTAGPASLRLERAIDADASDLAGALSLVASLASSHRRTRVVLLSDGLYTGADPRAPETLAALGPIPIWYREIGRPPAVDVAAGALSLPPTVPPGAGFVVRFSIESRAPATARYRLVRGETVIAGGVAKLEAGSNTFFTRDRVSGEEAGEYRLEVQAEGDTVPENDVARALLRVDAAPRVLLVSGPKGGGLLHQILRSAAIPVDLVEAAGMDWSAARLAPYRVVILENLPLHLLGYEGARSLATAVESGVCALLVTGGEGAFGPGGYHRSPLDPLLPVTMELREELRRGVMALAAVLDRSGSMNAAVRDGRTKMELANLGVAESIRLLSPQDELSVIAVDEQPHVIVPLVRADDTSQLVDAVLRIRSEGGGIFVFNALEAAVAELRKSGLPTRHLLLFSDAQDSEQQEGSVELAGRLRREGIGVSVIGLGTDQDSDAAFLKALAKAGEGQIYFTNYAEDLPRVFSQEVLRVAQRGFVKAPTPVEPLPDLARLQLPAGLPPPPTDGYNLTALREGASSALMTGDEDRAPLVAFWQHGRASAGAVMLELDGPSSGPFARWERLPSLVVNLVRLLAAGVTNARAGAQVTFDRGRAELRLEVGDETADRLRAAPLTARCLPPAGGEPIEVPLEWIRPDTALARLTLSSPGHYLPVVDLGRDGVLEAPAVSVPYSLEFLPAGRLDGGAVLEELARATGGEALVRADEAFSAEEVTAAASSLDVSAWIAALMLALLLLEAAERRLTFSELVLRWAGGIRRAG